MYKEHIDHTVQAEIDLKKLAENYKHIKSYVKSAEICAVLKANAYGHGDIECAKVALENGCTRIAVARLDEAINLRNGEIKAPILLLGYADPNLIQAFADYDVTISCGSYENFKQLLDKCKKLNLNKKINLHIKINTGMGRLGFDAYETQGSCIDIENIEQIKKIIDQPYFNIEGIYTHFAEVENIEKTKNQFKIFKNLLDNLQQNGINIAIKHCCNSGAIITLPEAHLDMVRVGITQYGLSYTSSYNDVKNFLKPIMTVKAKIVSVRLTSENFHVGYNSTYITNSTRKIAVVGIGYADGYFRQLSNKGYMIVNGKRANIVGNICMDLTMIDVTEIPYVNEGDIAIVFGYYDDKTILPAEELASLANTISYDLVSKISDRVFRKYIK